MSRTVFVTNREGRHLYCKACNQEVRVGDHYRLDNPFCARKRCIKKRAQKAEEGAANDLNQGGPAIKIRPLR